MKNRKSLVLVAVFSVALFQVLLFSSVQGGMEIPVEEGISYRIIEGSWQDNPSNGMHTGTTFVIYNSSFSQSIVLGLVHLIEPDGTHHTWNGISGYPIPPFGSYSFNFGHTGLDKLDETIRGGWLVGITWEGQPDDAWIVGRINAWDTDTGELLTTRTVYPF